MREAMPDAVGASLQVISKMRKRTAITKQLLHGSTAGELRNIRLT